MKIVLITSGQPSLNPRLVKEADTLSEEGYDVTVIYQYWNYWGTVLDVKLLADKKWNYKRVGGSPTQEKFLYLYTKIKYKISKKLAQYLGLKYYLPEWAIGRTTYLLVKEAKQIKADLYIAHNLAALPATVKAAKINNTKSGFDAEDFHRREVSNNPKNFDVQLSKFIEDKYIPQIDYLTTASPLISEAYQNLYPNKKPKTILNVFPKQQIRFQKSKPLKLFWFSQTIGTERGIENIIEALGKLKDAQVELHLLGNQTGKTISYFHNLAKRNGVNNNLIFFYAPIPADEIFAFASQFDIGLATELSTPKNRDICLTNKVFTYMQSNLAIIASDTSAQKQLLENYPNMGIVYEKDNSESLALVINNYIENIGLLIDHQKQAYQYATDVLNWEVEKEKFLTLVKQTLEN